MNYKKLLYILLLLPMLFIYNGCSKDDDSTAPPTVNEAEELAKYLEQQNMPAGIASMMTATDVRTGQLTGANQIVLDIRSATDFADKGHIEGAVNVEFKDLLTYYKANNLQSKTKVIIACYSGQTAGYAVGLLRLLGYSNVTDLKWGMTSWNSACDSWSSKTANSRATQFVTTATPKNAAGSLPTLSTGKSTPQEILEARVQELLNIGFSNDTKVSVDAVFQNLNNYYMMNYWPVDHYNTGHIPGAVQYEAADLKFSTNLKTLPADKPVVVYCYTGQTSAHLIAYLRVMGYDGRTLLYGCNAMIYDSMPGAKFVSTEINDFPLVH
ncbi:MAG: rhodanese-like domain-containing protein [Ignavibacteriaceae bacterium]